MSVNRKNELLGKLERKEITQEEFMNQCYLWSLEPQCVVEYVVRQYPPIPADLNEYYSLPMKEKYKISQDFFNQPDIKEYITTCNKVYSSNLSDYSWLSEIKRHLPDNAENLQNHITLDSLLSGYRNWLKKTSPEVEKLKEVFDGRVV